MCRNYQLIFMDIEMPGENGIDTTIKIKKIASCQNTFIIGCSGHAEEEQKLECL